MAAQSGSLALELERIRQPRSQLAVPVRAAHCAASAVSDDGELAALETHARLAHSGERARLALRLLALRARGPRLSRWRRGSGRRWRLGDRPEPDRAQPARLAQIRLP